MCVTLCQWIITSDFRSSDYVFEFFGRAVRQQQEYKHKQQRQQELRHELEARLLLKRD